MAVSIAVSASDPEPADTMSLDEVSVTALKQGLDLRMQPVSATVISAAQARRMGVLSMKDMSEIAPNFYIADYGTRMTSSIYVRGLGARIDQPVVGLNVDNVPYLNKDNYDFDLLDLERIEVVRGPQTTLYGRNTMGGVINLYTLSPFRWQGTRLMIEGATGPSARIGLSSYLRFNPRLAMSLALYGIWSNGFYRNQFNGQRTGTERGGSLRWKTEWKPSPALSLMNVAAFGISRQSGYPYQYENTGRIEYNDTCFYRRNFFSDGLTVSWQTDAFKLSGITSVQYLDDNMTLDQDFLPMSYFNLTQRRHEWTVTQDIVIRGSAGAYQWLGGLFGFFKRTRMWAPVTFLDDGIRHLIEDHRNEANPDYPVRWDSRSFVLGSDFTYPVYGLAAYHQSSYVTGRWTFTAGIRLDYEHSALSYRSYTNTGFTVYQGDPSAGVIHSHVPVDIDDPGDLSRHSLQLLPRLTVKWRIPMRQEGVIYLTVSDGYKSGGYNTQMFSDVLQQRIMGIMGLGSKYSVDDIVSYKPEKSRNYELGFHVSCADGRVETDFASFFIDCRDQQLTMFPDGTTTGRITTNAGRTHSYGLELSLHTRPVNPLTFDLDYGWTHARFRKYSDGIHDYRGNTVPYAPQHTLYTRLAYTFSLNSGSLRGLTLSADCRGIGPIFWDDDNSARQNFYLLPGASAILRANRWSLTLRGTNLSNTRYNTFSFISIGNRFYQQGRPAVVEATFNLFLQRNN